ncbi:hypothetical protein [Streptomyces sp. NPDC017940]
MSQEVAGDAGEGDAALGEHCDVAGLFGKIPTSWADIRICTFVARFP